MKTNKRTRVISWLLTLVMLVGMLPLSVLPASAKAREGLGTENDPYLVYDYDELQQWITEAPANASIYFQLVQNLEYIQSDTDAKKIDITDGKKIFLDLCSQNIYVEQNSDGPALPYMFRVTGGSTLTIGDSNPYISQVHLFGGNYIKGRFLDDKKPHNLIRVEDNSCVVINGVNLVKSCTIADNSYPKTDMPNGTIAADETSEIIINGGSVRGANYTLDTRVTENLYRRDCAIASYGKLTINGGEFVGVVGIIDLPDGNDVDVTINGGVFNNCVQVDAELTASDTFNPRIAIYGGNFKDRFVVNPGVKGISVETKFYIPILLRGGTFSSLVTKSDKKNIEEHDCEAISLYDASQDGIIGSDTAKRRAKMSQNALAECIGNSVVYIRYCSDEYKYKTTKYSYITRKNMSDGVGIYPNIGTMYDDAGYVEISPNSFGLKDVLLDSNPVEKPVNIDDGGSFVSGNVPFYSVSELGSHTLTFRWYDLPQEMKDDGYSYKVTFQTQSVSEFEVPSSSILTTATAEGTVFEWNYTIPKTHTTTQQATFRLDLMKDGELVSDTATHNDYLLMYKVAESTKAVIGSVFLDISAPLVEGDKTSGTVTRTGVGGGYSVTKDTCWVDNDTDYELNGKNDYYLADLKTQYAKSITLKVNDGFAFDSSNKPTVEVDGLASDYDYYVRVADESTAYITLYSYPTPVIAEAIGTVKGLHKDNYVRDITVEPRVSGEYTFKVLKILRIGSDGTKYLTTPGEKIDENSKYKIYLTANAKWGYAFKEGDPVYDVNTDTYTHSRVRLRMETDDYGNLGEYTTYGAIPPGFAGDVAYISPDLEVDVSCKHNHVTYVPRLSPTCQTVGHTAYTKCDDCGEIVDGENKELSRCYHEYDEEKDYVHMIWPTHDEDGMNNHYKCQTPGCNQYFDTFGNETTKEALTMPKHQSDGIWQYDATKHWQNCEYDWCEKKVGEGEHVSTGDNVATCLKKATCDTCGATYGDVLSHNYDSAWSANEYSHYHKCLNDDCVARFGYGSHDFTAAVKKAEALKTAGTNGGEAVYYYSCSVCGRVEKNDSHTFKGTEIVGYDVSGSVVSFLNGTDAVTIQLIEQGHTEVAYETTVSGGTQSGNKYTAAYSFSQVPAGTYTMKVSKANHVTREYTVTVGAAAVTQDVQINLLGDANCDDKVDISDAVMILQSISNPDKYGVDGTSEYHITSQGVINGDVYDNGTGLTSSDALSIQKYIVELIPELPESKLSQ